MTTFDRVLSEQPDDMAAKELHARAAAYLMDPPPPEWTGVYEVTTK